MSVNVGPIRDADGNILYTLGIIENIDERKRFAQTLLDSETRLRLLNERLEQQAEERAAQLASSRALLQAFFVNSPDWLTLQRATPDGRIVYADINPTSEAAYGLPRDQVVGRTVEEVLGVEAAQIPLHHLRECLRTGQPQHYVARRTMAGRTTTIDVMFVLVPEVAEGGDRYIITTARDLTEREHLEAQLRQAQKMEAIGQLTGGVAHDFNNLLAIIGGNAELVRRRPTGNTARQMDNILLATERGVALTRQLLSFSRRHVATPQIIDLRSEMPRMAEMLRASLRGNIQMRIDVAEQVWPIEVDLAELEMALLNIAVNARDAMPQGGTFTIDVRNAARGGGMLNSEHVAIALRDSGIGIPPDVIGKVFDPFFTTKEPGEGTGLGLSQVYGFAHQSGGAVSLDSVPGQGTTITIRLPRSSHADAEVARRRQCVGPGNSERAHSAGRGQSAGRGRHGPDADRDGLPGRSDRSCAQGARAAGGGNDRHRPVADRCDHAGWSERRRSRHPDTGAVPRAADHPDLRLQRRGRRHRVSSVAQAGSVRRSVSCDLRWPEEGTRQHRRPSARGRRAV